MNRLLLTALWGVMTSAHAHEAALLYKDFRIMMAWLPRVYDNQEQVYFEAEQEVDEALRPERIHHVFEPVDLPAFGEHVFYVQQHPNDDPAQIYVQRSYALRHDFEEGAVRLVINIPNHVASLVDVHFDPSQLSDLSPEQTRVLPGCNVF